MKHLKWFALIEALALATSVEAFPANGIGGYKTPEEACAAWAAGSKGKATPRDTGDGHVGCTLKDGDNERTQESVGQANCPLNAHPKDMRSCECDAGYTYGGNACVDKTGDTTVGKVPPKPSADWLNEMPVSCKREQNAAAKEARKKFVDGGGKVEVAKGVEKHHIMTDKDQKYRPQFAKIAEGADASLNDQINLISLSGHKGPHGAEYHEAILKRMQGALKNKQPHTREYKSAFTDAMKEIRRDLARAGSALNQTVCK
jgi:A nuclease family of the HNH/ENDO VII superfamily with conserved AHH